MGNCTEVYLVGLAKLRQLVGSDKTESLVSMLSLRQKDLIQAFDRQFGSGKAQQVLSELLNGQHPTSGYGGAPYAYALRILLREVSMTLSNSCFCPFRMAWLDNLDEVLKAQQLSEWKFSNIIGFQPPFPMACPEDYPSVCTIDEVQAERLATVFSALKLEGLDSDTTEAIQQASSWFQRAAQGKSGLILLTV